MKPVLESIFDATLSYKSQDFRNIDSALNLLKTFTLTDEEFISHDNKLKIVNAAFDLPEDSEGDPVPKAQPLPVVQGPQPPPPRGNA